MTREDVENEIEAQAERAANAESRVEEFRSDELVKESVIESALVDGVEVRSGAYLARVEAGEVLVYKLEEVREL